MRRFWIGLVWAAVIGSAAATSAAGELFGDFNEDGDVDLYDYYALQICLGFSGPDFSVPATCNVFDLKSDGDVDLEDVAAFVERYSGSSGALRVEAGGLVPIAATFGSYYSGEPGKTGQNALNGIAAQAGFTQDDLWYQWTVDSQPEFSGQVILSNSSRPATAFRILSRTLPGEYVFQLSVTNLDTGEMASDFVRLHVSGCTTDTECDDNYLCTADRCQDGLCVNELLPCDDGIACTADVCITESGECAHSDSCPPTQVCDPQSQQCRDIVCEFDSQCDDGQFCNGVENCTLFACVAGDSPCAENEVCDETNNACNSDGCVTFTVNQDNLAGTPGDDHFCAPLVFVPQVGQQIATLQTGDSANGLAGTDVLNASFSVAANVVPTSLEGIETINMTNFAAGTATLSAGGISGVDVFGTVSSVNDITVAAIQEPADFSASSINSTAVDFTLQFGLAATTSGSIDTITGTLSDVNMGTVTIQTAAGTTNGFESLTLNSIGTVANSMAGVTQTGGTTLTICTITGTQPLRVGQLPNTVRTVNAEFLAEGLQLGIGNAVGTYTPFNIAVLQSVIGSPGNDVLIFGSTLDFSDFASGTCNLGDGDDIVQISYSADFPFPSPFRNVEEVRVNAMASGLTVNFNGHTGLTTLTVEEDGTSNTLLLQNVAGTANAFPKLNFRGDNSTGANQTFDTVTYNAIGNTGSSDSLTVNVGNRGTAINSGTSTTFVLSVGGAASTLNGFEMVAINCADGPCIFSGIGATTLVTLNVTGSSNVTLGQVDATGSTILSVNASNVTGNFIATVDEVATGANITLGAGNDIVIVGANSFATSTFVSLGAGNDFFVGDTNTASADTISAGDGVDTIFGGQGVDTIFTGSGSDTVIYDQVSAAHAKNITDFTLGVGGDTLRFDISALALANNGAENSGTIAGLTNGNDIFLRTGAGFASDAAAETAITADDDAAGPLVFIYFNTTDNSTHILYDTTAETDATPPVLIGRLTSITTQAAHDQITTAANVDSQP
ncbi:MAG: hypothetical protein AABZ47_15075 [Planctomycetota bacterium]